MIPLKIETLLEGKVVERNRVEYKQGWNPSDIIHTICAFANDYANVNGGYLVIGVAENDGIPVLPPKGIAKEQLDSIQKEIFQYCNLIEPRYLPTIEICDYPDSQTHLIYLKCSPGDAGPYRAPKEVYSKRNERSDKTMYYWIRPSALTTPAKHNEIGELFEKFNAIPFDDRINPKATLECIRRGHLEDFLRDSNSSLVTDMNNRSLEDLLLSLEVATETDTDIALRNIAVLMFSEHPEKLIPGAQIDLIHFTTPEAEAGDSFIEKTFTGPIWKQVINALDYLRTNVIVSKITKIENQEKSIRHYNYPFNAVEEALVNAVFHKSYRENCPAEIRIYVDRLIIINYPGPDKWINMDKFSNGQVRARKYRNRRIGELFKEIDLSEKQGTGIPKIIRELSSNGSPAVNFETDEDRTYLETTFFIHPDFVLTNKMSDKMSDIVSDKMSDTDMQRMKLIKEAFPNDRTFKNSDVAELLSISSKTAARLLAKAEDASMISGEGKNKGKRYRIR